MIIVVGGQGRGTGKTTVVAGLIRAIPEVRWIAVKISPHPHGGPLPVSGYDFTEEDAAGSTNTGRFLAAGAQRAILLRTRPEGLARAARALKAICEASEGVIIESNAILDHLQPDLFLVVLDPGRAEWKESAMRHMDRADAILFTRGKPAACRQPQFAVAPPEYVTQELAQFVRARLPARQ